MCDQYARRALLGTVGAVVLGGCVEGGDTDDGPTDNRTNSGDDGTDMDSNSTESPEEQLDRLPEPRPMSSSLVALVRADDRGRFAETTGLRYRDGAVEVEIMLESDGEWPKEYLAEDASGYDGTIISYVAVEDLVDLATDENVRFVDSYEDPEPGALD